LAANQKSPVEIISRKQQEQSLWEAIENLDEEHREIVNLRHFQDLSYSEIAELLGVPKGTVMSRLYRARMALAKKIREKK
jgi:RNA polymerase sigma-70 factor (ECF subfamily)